MPLLDDLRFAVRSLRRTPGLVLIVVVTLGFGIGANSALFSLLQAVLLRPFPFAQPHELVRINSIHDVRGELQRSSAADVVDWAERASTLSGVAYYSWWRSDLIVDAEPGLQTPETAPSAQVAQSAQVGWVTPAFFDVLGVPPRLGRTHLTEEDEPGGETFKAVLSHGLWQRSFGADPNPIGRTLRIRDTVYTVIGVMPDGFGYPDGVDLWVPIQSWWDLQNASGESYTGDRFLYRASRSFEVVARLGRSDGESLATVAQVQAELDVIAANLADAYPDTNEGFGVHVRTLREVETGDLRPYVLALAGAVALVLLIACTNVANLLLVRGSRRRGELALRRALGAGRRQLARLLLVEGLLLALAGGALGLLLATLGVDAFLRSIPVELPFWLRVEVDGGVLAFTFGVTLLTCLLAVLVPAWQASRVPPQAALRDDGRGAGAGGRAQLRLRQALIVAQVALSLMLLAGAALMVRSFLHLQHVDPGFEPDGLLTAYVAPHFAGNRTDRTTAYTSYYNRAIERLAALPGVTAAGGARNLPFYGGQAVRPQNLLAVTGADDEKRDELIQPLHFSTDPGYFDAMGIPLIEGRFFTAGDTQGSQPVVIINQRAARELWPGRSPIGQELKWGGIDANNFWCTIVGVVGDVKARAEDATGGVEIYYAYAQWITGSLHFVLRTDGDPSLLVPTVHRTLAQVDPNVAVVHVKPMRQLMDDSIWRQRLWSLMFGTFAGLALLLAAIGIYGVMAYTVALRRQELAVRRALGANSTSIFRLIAGGGLRLAVTGVALGLAGALALSGLLRDLLFGITPQDPGTFAGVALLLGAIAVLATLPAASRALRVDPMTVLREE